MIPFFEWGFGLPPHDFLHGFLHHYRAQLHHLSPNGILHLSCFVTLCEAFLRIPPHSGLWTRIFTVKPQPVEPKGRLQLCGGIGIQPKPSAHYFNLRLPDGVKKWQAGWFYCLDSPALGRQQGLPAYSPEPVIRGVLGYALKNKNFLRT